MKKLANILRYFTKFCPLYLLKVSFFLYLFHLRPTVADPIIIFLEYNFKLFE